MAGTPDDPAHTSRSRSFDTTHYVVVLLRETAVCCRAELPHEIVDEPLELVNRPLSRPIERTPRASSSSACAPWSAVQRFARHSPPSPRIESFFFPLVLSAKRLAIWRGYASVEPS